MKIWLKTVENSYFVKISRHLYEVLTVYSMRPKVFTKVEKGMDNVNFVERDLLEITIWYWESIKLRSTSYNFLHLTYFVRTEKNKEMTKWMKNTVYVHI